MAAKEAVQRLITGSRVLVFSKTFCPYCAKVKDIFKGMQAPMTVVELDTRDDGDALQKALVDITKQRTVPNVFISGQHIGGSTDVSKLQSSGELQNMLKDQA